MKNLSSEDLQSISQFFQPIQPLLDEVLKEFKVYIVGGFTRDYLLNKSLSKDIDCELHLRNNSDDFLEKYTEFFEKLKSSYQIKKLSFNIFQVYQEDFVLEFSLPRKEAFDETQGHKNFTAKFFSTLPLGDAAQRRDFTFNAIYLLMEKNEKDFDFKLCDPLGGVSALEEKNVVSCGDDFFRDPVRSLRAIRFAINLDFSIMKIERDLKKMDPFHSSFYYFVQEANKCKRPASFLQKIIELWPDKLNHAFKFFEEFNWSNLKEDVNFEDICREALKQSNRSKDDKVAFCQYFHLKQKTFLK